MSKARDEYEIVIESLPVKASKTVIMDYVQELEQRIADLIGAVQDFARENSELEARCGELEQNLSTAQDMMKLLRADCAVRDEQNKELINSLARLLGVSTKGGWLWTYLSPLLERITGLSVDEAIRKHTEEMK